MSTLALVLLVVGLVLALAVVRQVLMQRGIDPVAYLARPFYRVSSTDNADAVADATATSV